MPRTREEIEGECKHIVAVDEGDAEWSTIELAKLNLEVALDIRDAVQKLTSSEK